MKQRDLLRALLLSNDSINQRAEELDKRGYQENLFTCKEINKLINNEYSKSPSKALEIALQEQIIYTSTKALEIGFQAGVDYIMTLLGYESVFTE